MFLIFPSIGVIIRLFLINIKLFSDKYKDFVSIKYKKIMSVDKVNALKHIQNVFYSFLAINAAPFAGSTIGAIILISSLTALIFLYNCSLK